jgi:histidinol dehydrogenase
MQTAICAINGAPPPAEEAAAWERLALELAAPGHLSGFQIYGKVRPSPGDTGDRGAEGFHAAALPAAFLEARAASLRAALPAGKPVPVEVFP